MWPLEEDTLHIVKEGLKELHHINVKLKVPVVIHLWLKMDAKCLQPSKAVVKMWQNMSPFLDVNQCYSNLLG